MNITDLRGVGPVTAQRLDAAGLGSVDAIAAATIDDLTTVAGVGPRLATSMKTEAQQLVSTTAASPVKGAKKVARSVKGLRSAIPDLAGSKKQAKRLKQSTKRMAGWVDDLGRRRVRKRFIAEIAKLSAEAKKRTASKKDAKALRKHAAGIEKAVRKAG